MNLTINDFRNVLGKVNDGNVVFTADGNGDIEKANHGNLISKHIYNYRQVPSDPVENQEIRKALMRAISASSEGRLLTSRQILRLKTMIGIGGDGLASEEALSRKTLKSVLDTVELMARGEDDPAAADLSERIKGVPVVGDNRLVKEQLAALDCVGYGTGDYKSVVDTAKAHAQDISRLMDEAHLGRMFKQGFLGQPAKKMMIFVRESAAHIQSQIFDKLLWKYVDLMENAPGEGVDVDFEYGKAEDVFLEVVQEMMEEYGRKRDPLPKAKTMLERPNELGRREAGFESENLPSLGDKDGLLAKAGEEFLKESLQRLQGVSDDLYAKFEALEKCLKPPKADFNSRQVGNFMRQLKNYVVQKANKLLGKKCELYTTFITAFNGTSGDAEVRQQAAKQAVEDFLRDIRDTCDIFSAVDGTFVKLSDRFAENPTVRSHIFQTLADRIGRRSADETLRMEPSSIVRQVTWTVSDIETLCDLEPLAQAIAVELALPSDDQDVIARITDILKDAGGELADLTDGVRVKLAEARIKDPDVNSRDIATSFVRTNDIVGLVQKRFSAGDDVKLARKAKDDQLAVLGKARSHANKSKLMIGDAIMTRSALKKIFKEAEDEVERGRKKLSDLKRKLDDNPARIAEIEGRLESQGSSLGEDEEENLRMELLKLKHELRKLPKDITAQEKILENSEFRLKDVKEEYKDYDEDYFKVVGGYRDVDEINEILDAEDAERDVKFTEEERKERFDQLNAELEASQITRGKLVAVLGCGLIDERPEIRKQLLEPRSTVNFKITPRNLQLALEVADQLLAERSLSDLKALGQYISDGGAVRDVSGQTFVSNPWVFRDMYLDRRFDLDGTDPKARAYLGDCVDEGAMVVGGGSVSVSAGRNVPDAVFGTYYRELRQAVVDVVGKINVGLNDKDKLKLDEVLADSKLSEEDPPADGEIPGFYSCFEDGEKRFSIKPFKEIYGFGTNDPKVQSGILKRIGLSPADLNRPEGWMKAQRLTVLVKMHGGIAEGVLEWAERVIGKPFAEMTFSDLIEKAASVVSGKAIADPVNELKGDNATIAKFLAGEIKLWEAKLDTREMPAVLNGLRSLAAGGTGAEFKLFKRPVSVGFLPDGSLTARLVLGNGKTMPLGVSRTIDELIVQVENQIVEHAGELEGKELLSSLPPIPKWTDLHSRPREMYAKTLSTLLGLPSVNFAHLPIAELYAEVVEVVNSDQNGRAGIAKKFEKAPTTYNSAEMVELREQYLRSDVITRGLVKVPEAEKVRSLEERIAIAPSDEKVHDFLAELVMNRDTWAYDEGTRTPGLRIRNLVQSYRPEIRHLANDSRLLDSLPKFLREGMSGILADLQNAAEAEGGGDGLAACAAIEEKIAQLVDDAMETMQTEATNLFGLSKGDQRKPWQKGLNELNGSDGLSQSTSQGRFNKYLLDNYFKRSDPIEKRAMLANLIRNTDASSSKGKLVGEMLKGAGPLLQKTLQGLSASTFGPETQIALKDMKSKLLPIPDSDIKAQLLELVRSSDGDILSIEVKRSIGQATVGQALLCHMRTKEHPVVGEYVVVKLLRPNVQTAVQREYKLFMELAKELDDEEKTGDSQQKTFEGRYRTVLNEFDFTLEASNIDLCLGVYDKPTVSVGKNQTRQYTSIHSMDRSHDVPPMVGAIVLQKVEGVPMDRMLEDTDKAVEDLVKDIKIVTRTNKEEPPVTVYRAKDPGEALNIKLRLWEKRRVLLEQHHEVAKLVDAWLDRALFGNGVFHNDLHPGNVMINGFDLSVIDFGNVGRLSKDQQTALIFMFAGAMNGSEDDFLEGVEKLMGKKIDNTKTPADPSTKTPAGPGLRDRLKAAITEIFSKGTSDDVLPRMIGALSALKDFAIPVPEVIHNFAESMSRLQTVVDGVVDEIAKIETVSDEITVDEAWIRDTRLSEKWDAVGIDFLDDLKQVVKAMGTAEKKFDFEMAQDAAQAYLDKVRGDDFKAKTAKRLNDVVFNMEDGGEEYLREIISLMQSFPNSTVTPMSNGHIKLINQSGSATQFERYVNAYVKARRDNRPVEIERRQADIVGSFRETISNFASNFLVRSLDAGVKGGFPDSGPIIGASSKPGDFVLCVGKSLTSRKDGLQSSLASYMKIPKPKFDAVMRLVEEGANEAAIFREAGVLDSFKFRRLKGIADKIEAAEDAKKDFEERLAKVIDMPLEDGGADKVRRHLSNYEMRKIERCAHEFRYPLAWGRFSSRGAAKTELGKNRIEVLQVFRTNLDAIKKALGTERLSDVQLKYFVRVAAAATRDLNFSEFLEDYDEAGLKALANGSAELETMMAYYRQAVRDIE